jgi:F-type H+-transporting ATPase subunit b
VELDWVTFTLEIVNFLILVWILQRFLYKPILQIIARRKAVIEQTLTDAKARHADAEALESRYRDRLAVWEEEKAHLREQAETEMDAERARRMAALGQSLAQEREKHQALEKRQLQDRQRQLEQAALAQGAQFAAGLLGRFAAPDLEAQLVHMVAEELPKLPGDILEQVRQAQPKAQHHDVKVASAFTLKPEDRDLLEQRLFALLGASCTVAYDVDPQLRAGVRLSIGPWVLRANLQDELKFFAEASHRAV